MATSYGYGGEFSSDEDIDRIEQQSEVLVHNVYDGTTKHRLLNPVRPTREQVEEIIESLKKIPADRQDFRASDEELAALLDYYGPTRGPIVDSTRALYKKIVLRYVRGENSDNEGAQGNGTNTEKVGIQNNNNIIIKNSNSNNGNLIKKPAQQPSESFSSDDDDEPTVPVSETIIARAKPTISEDCEKIEPMEVDAEKNLGKLRESKQVDITDDESEEEEDTSEEEDDDDDNNDDIGDDDNADPSKDNSVITPLRPTSHVLGQTPKATSTPLAPKRQRQNAKDYQSSTAAKKPYTRSQRMAATKASMSNLEAMETSEPGTKQETARDAVQLGATRRRLAVGALVILLIAFLMYYFRSSVMKTTDRLLSRKINF